MALGFFFSLNPPRRLAPMALAPPAAPPARSPRDLVVSLQKRLEREKQELDGAPIARQLLGFYGGADGNKASGTSTLRP